MSDIIKMSRKELKARLEYKCIHGHNGISHPNCFVTENNIPEKIAFFDIESESLDADYGIVFCVTPDTKVLLSNLTWKKAGELKEGDSLIGVDEFPKGGAGSTRKFRESIVERIGRKKTECIKISTDCGEITVSKNHRFLIKNKFNNRIWEYAENLKINDEISFVVAPWSEKDQTFEFGWLGGMYDGEGCLVAHKHCGRFNLYLMLTQVKGEVLNRAKQLLQKLAVDVREHAHTGKNGNHIRNLVLGKVGDIFKVLGICQPNRLISKVSDKILGQRGLKTFKNAKVLKTENVGVKTVVPMQTSTATFISNGFVSHNCWCILDSITGEIHYDRITLDDIKKGSSKKRDVHPREDSRILKNLIDKLQTYDRVVAHYGIGFDVPFIRTRAVICDLEFPSYGTLAQSDTWVMLKKKFKLSRNSLENGCRNLVGASRKDHLSLAIKHGCLRGEEWAIQDCLNHCKKDVEDLRDLYEKINKFTRKTKTSI